MDPIRLFITVDDRERLSAVPSLLALVPGIAVRTAHLAAGDYDLGNGIVVERKTPRGFVLSLMSGQLFRQAGALKLGAERPVLLLEGGSLYETGIAIDSSAIRGALVSLAAIWYLPVLRAAGPRESVEVLVALARQARREVRGPWRRPGHRPRRPERRKSYVLQGLPRVGPVLAARLLARFGSIRAVASATEAELAEVEGIGPRLARAIRETVG
jgi:DNA excision repair protein ERCC-4